MGREYAPVPGKWYENREEEETFRVLSVDEDDELIEIEYVDGEIEELDLDMSGPFIRIDDRCATSMRNVWAVGDVTGEPMLAHRAMAQGEMVAQIVAGHRRRFQKVAIPAVWAFNYFTTKIDNLVAEMTYVSKEMIDYLIKGVSGEFGRSRFTREFNATGGGGPISQ